MGVAVAVGVAAVAVAVVVVAVAVVAAAVVAAGDGASSLSPPQATASGRAKAATMAKTIFLMILLPRLSIETNS
jgi:uncharacterized membrane protein YphA (DoxX/SURF4 family)